MLMAVDITKHFEEMLGQAAPSPVLPEPTMHWCMVLVRPGFERECRDSLRRRGVGAWWPNFTRQITKKDRDTGKRYQSALLVSVLPGLLLSPARMTEAFWSALDLAPGAQNVARKFNTDVVLLTDLDIALIHRIEVGLHRTDPPKSTHSYAVGDSVRFVDDELRRLPPGEIVECGRDGHIRLDVNMFGRMTTWTVASWQIEPLDEPTRIRAKTKSTDARDRPAKSPSR